MADAEDTQRTGVPSHRLQMSQIDRLTEDKPPRRSSCPSWLLLHLVLSVCMSGSVLFGLNMTVLNTCLDTVAVDLQWCTDEEPSPTQCPAATYKTACVASAVFLGACLGSISAGSAVRAFGCRRVLLFNMMFPLLGVIFSVVSASFSTLVAARFLVGSGVGVSAVVTPIYISEVSPKAHRGFYGCIHQLFISGACWLGVLLGLPLSPIPSNRVKNFTLSSFDRLWWRCMLGCGAVPVIFAWIVFPLLYTFETPYYYIRQGKPALATEVLRRLTNRVDVQEEVEEIVRLVNEAKSAPKISIFSILRKPLLRRILLIGCLFSAGQQFVGINVFMTTSNSLFLNAGLPSQFVTLASIFIVFLQIPMTLVAMILLDGWGRRRAMIFGLIGMMAAIAPGALALLLWRTTSFAAWCALAGAVGFIVFYGMSYGPICWIYIFEIFPTDLKDIGAGLATTSNWVAAFLMVFTTKFFSTAVAYSVLLMFQGGLLVFVMFCMRETKGRALGDSPYSRLD